MPGRTRVMDNPPVPNDVAPAVVKPKIRADIQGLRMVAVVAVILNHLLGWPAGGFVGVDVFFVISGFLITSLLVTGQEKSGRVQFAAFFRARFRRIVPAAAFALAATAVAARFLFNETRAASVLNDSIFALFMSVNWRFADAGTDYFQARGPVSPLQHYWSLSVEQQLYLVWPLLVALAVLLAKRRIRAAVGAVLLTVTVTSFFWALHESAENPTVAYFSTWSRIWELAVGGLIAVAAGLLVRLPNWLRPLLAWIGVAGIGLSFAVINGVSRFPGPSAALPVLATVLVIAAGTGGRIPWFWPLTNPVAGYIGDLSFSLYLWHFPVIVFVTELVGDGTGEKLLAAAIFSVLAIYSYHLLEDPIRRSSWLTGRAAGPGRGFYRPAEMMLAVTLAFAVAAGATVAVLNGVSNDSSNLASTPAADPITATAGSTPTGDKPPSPTPTTVESNNHTEQDKLQTEISAALAATSWPTLTPSLDQVMAGDQAPADVLWCGTHTVDESLCTWGDPAATHTIVTVGDSISMTYVEAIRAAIGTDRGWNLVSYGMFGCPFRDEVPAEAPAGCAGRTDEAVAAINRLRPDVVIYAGIADGEGAAEPLARVDGKPKVIFLAGPPRQVDPMTCFTVISSPADCVDHLDGDWGRLKVAAKEQNRMYLDSSKWFCADADCPMFVGSIPVRMDRFHMTTAYADRLAPVIREAFVRAKILPLN